MHGAALRRLLICDSPDGHPGQCRRTLREEQKLTGQTEKTANRLRGLYTLAMVNTAIWALAIVALVFVIQRAPSARGLYVILAGGTAVSVTLASAIAKAR